jgi:predicted Rossmann fold flavoprotein
VQAILKLVRVGDGYEIAKKLGHTITEIKPGLVPLECYEKNLVKEMQGLSLKNVGIKVLDKANCKKIYEDFGEMLFTHFGVSGPVIISASSHLVRYKDIEKLFKDEKIELVIDLKPALDTEKLDLRIRRDFEFLINKKFKNSLDKLLPQKMIEPVIRRSKIEPEKKVNEITKEERRKLGEVIKNFTLKINGFRGVEEAIITSRRS